jgi:hypothetical protein
MLPFEHLIHWLAAKAGEAQVRNRAAEFLPGVHNGIVIRLRGRVCVTQCRRVSEVLTTRMVCHADLDSSSRIDEREA